MTVITLTENDIEYLRAGHKIKMIVSSEKSEDIRVCIAAMYRRKKGNRIKMEKNKVKLFILLAVMCAVCAGTMLVKRNYALAVMDTVACAIDLYAAWLNYKS